MRSMWDLDRPRRPGSASPGAAQSALGTWLRATALNGRGRRSQGDAAADDLHLGLEPDQPARALLRLDIDWATHDADRRARPVLATLAKDKDPAGTTNLVTATVGLVPDVVSAR
jgi:hypothetical protein